MKRVFTSDSHIEHHNICKLANRPWSAEENTEMIIRIWNKNVSPKDTVYNLGDFFFKTHRDKDVVQVIDTLEQLNGNIVLIKGNHDDPKLWEKVKEHYVSENNPDKIKVMDYCEINIEGRKAVMFHYPMISWNGMHRGSMMLHGHCVPYHYEILTNNGWKNRHGFDKEKDQVYTYNPESELLELKKANYVVDNPEYSGFIYDYYLGGREMIVTDQHGLCDFTTKYKTIPADEFFKNKQRKVMVSGLFSAKGTGLSEDMLKLYIALAADANITHTNLCRFRFKRMYKLEWVMDLIERLNIPYTTGEYNKGVNAGMKWVNFRLPVELNEWRIKGLDNKLLDSSVSEIPAILEAYAITDGNRNHNSTIIYTSKKEEVDLLQHLFVTRGFSCKLHTRIGHGFSTKASHSLCVNNRQLITLPNVNGKAKKKFVENSPFWCINIENHNFLVRTPNGNVFLSGNCHGNLPDIPGRILDVGLDASPARHPSGNYSFWTEQDIVEYMNRREIHCVDHHKAN